MNELQKIFNYSGVQVRTVIKDGEPWFVAKDICEILEISKDRDAVSRLDDDERGSVLVDTLGGKQEVNAVNEYGLYELIFNSRKPEAKQFKRWVTHEVLPAIRKTGKYEVPNQLTKVNAVVEKVRALGWHETPNNKKQRINEELSKLRQYYFGLIDNDVAAEPEPMGVFLQECCTIDQDSITERTSLYNGYVRWSYSNNVYPKSKAKLTKFLDDREDIAYLKPDNKHGFNARFMGIALNETGLKILND